MSEDDGRADEGAEVIIKGARSWHRSENLERTRRILAGEPATAGEILDLADELRNREKRFGDARRLIERARGMATEDAGLRRKLRQRHALCTYKDPDLPAEERLDRALEILGEGEDLATTRDQETLGLAGAIFKRKWEIDARREQLERALGYYLAGYQVGPETDQGYTGINAAYVLDLLASVEEVEAAREGVGAAAPYRVERARKIREHLVAVLPGLLERPDHAWLAGKWWFYATMAEACFGLERYGEALEWLENGRRRSDPLPEWELESTVTQLAGLARIQTRGAPAEEFVRSEAFGVLSSFMGDNAAAALTAYVGKIGLALSGGGFRASLFHVGVLARLAELDMLRHVEVLSCVSGGSILGAHYYLELRRLLQEKEDADITRDDYIALVQRIETDFLKGIQKNLRTRIVGEFITNLKMIFRTTIGGEYSRTMRVGELFERFIYAEVKDGHRAPARWWRPWERYRRWLTDLYIVPSGAGRDFRPKRHNWRRRAKVPELVLNATTLNTGHNWQFTASWMGEPPSAIDPEVDGNARLRRMYYWEAPQEYRQVRLGYAVAASACVPGLFEPLSMPDLYPGMNVRLVDGGVFDNQGIGGLLDQDCNILLVSDASGQMDTEAEPSRGILGVPLRSNDILMSRVRGEQYRGLIGRRRTRLVRGHMFVHLKKGLPVEDLDWIRPNDDPTPDAPASDAVARARAGGQPSEPTPPEDPETRMHRALAAIRTDLDSFHEAEAFALMTRGYRLTEEAFREDEALRNLPLAADDAVAGRWGFLAFERAFRDETRSVRLLGILDVASRRALKVWKLSTLLKGVAAVAGLAAIAGLTYLFLAFRDVPLVTVGLVGMVVLTLVVGAIFGKGVVRVVRLRETLIKIGIGFALAFLGPLAVRTHLLIFDRLYLKIGKIEEARRGEAEDGGADRAPGVRGDRAA